MSYSLPGLNTVLVYSLPTCPIFCSLLGRNILSSRFQYIFLILSFFKGLNIRNVLLISFFLQELKYTLYFLLPSRVQIYFLILPSTFKCSMYSLFLSSVNGKLHPLFPSSFKDSYIYIPYFSLQGLYTLNSFHLQGLNILPISLSL